MAGNHHRRIERGDLIQRLDPFRAVVPRRHPDRVVLPYTSVDVTEIPSGVEGKTLVCNLDCADAIEPAATTRIPAVDEFARLTFLAWCAAVCRTTTDISAL